MSLLLEGNEMRNSTDGFQMCSLSVQPGWNYTPFWIAQTFAHPYKDWTYISMDFIQGLPKYGGKTIILVVVDQISKYHHFCALSPPYTTSSIAQIFMDKTFLLHGSPFFHCLRPQRNFHKSFSPYWHQTEYEFILSPTNRWFEWIHHQLLGNLYSSFHLWITTSMGKVAPSRWMVVQYFLP